MPYVPRPPDTIKCAHCKKPFERRHASRKYCSNSCNVLASYERTGYRGGPRVSRADLESALAKMMELMKVKPELPTGKPTASKPAAKAAAKAQTKKPAAKAAVKQAPKSTKPATPAAKAAAKPAVPAAKKAVKKTTKAVKKTAKRPTEATRPASRTINL